MFARHSVLTASVALMVMTSGVEAKDWIESVSVTQDGIDMVPVVVAADAKGYTAIKTPGHRFLFRLHAKATNGERIVAMKLGAYSNVLYFEGSGDRWNMSFYGREIGDGSKRTVTMNVTPVVPTARIAWVGGKTPRHVCAENLADRMKAGDTRKDVLARDWKLTAKARFELDAVAARKKNSGLGDWSLKNTTNQRSGYAYEVPVHCLSVAKRAS